MREIKFRAWSRFEDDDGNENWAMDEYGEVAVSVNGKPMTLDSLELDDSILMQYTGLKDKNGVEIYEGDIVRGRFVEEQVPDAMWLTLSEQEKRQGFRLFTINTIFEPYETPMPDDMEVIGNIYEHSHLLEK